MSGLTKRAWLVSRIALLASALAVATIGCGDDPEENAQLARRLQQLAESAFYDFLSPPPTLNDDCTVSIAPGLGGNGDAALIQSTIDDAMPWDVICLQPGVYTMGSDGSGPVEGTIRVDDTANLTLKGLGADPTSVELDYAGHTGGIGVSVTAPGFWLDNVWVHDANLVGVRIESSNGEDNPGVLRRIKVSWGADVSQTANGAIGLWLLGSDHVIAEFSEVVGASIAGIVVQGASNAIVRDGFPHANNVGISIENSSNVEVVSNGVTDNTTGILVARVSTPELTANENVLVVSNQVWNNNRASFTGASAGAAAAAPRGTGLMVVATTDTEFRDNWVYGNVSTALLVYSAITPELINAGVFPSFDPGFDPFPTNVWVNGNIWEFLPGNEFNIPASANGTAVDAAFRADIAAANAVVTPPTYYPLPPSFWDNPATTPPPASNLESNDPNTAFILETENRPIMLDGTLADFAGIPAQSPPFCLGTGDDNPVVFFMTDSRRGYPLPTGDAPRQDELACELPALPGVSFP